MSIFVHALGVYGGIKPWNRMVEVRYDIKLDDFERAAWVIRAPQIPWQLAYLLDLVDDE